MKGILLAGGRGTRLYPTTRAVNKHLLPVYNKPLIFYSLSALLFCGIREIVIISDEESLPQFRRLLGTGDAFGVHFEYRWQTSPRGIADAFIVASDFIDGSPSCLVLGDNIFWGDSLMNELKRATRLTDGAHVIAVRVEDARPYGVVSLASNGRPLEVIEKPHRTEQSYWAVPGVYFYDSTATTRAAALPLSQRGELEISALNAEYLRDEKLQVTPISGDYFWRDAGSPDSLLDAANFVATTERKSSIIIGSPEFAAFTSGLINREGCINGGRASAYAGHLSKVVSDAHLLEKV